MPRRTRRIGRAAALPLQEAARMLAGEDPPYELLMEGEAFDALRLRAPHDYREDLRALWRDRRAEVLAYWRSERVTRKARTGEYVRAPLAVHAFERRPRETDLDACARLRIPADSAFYAGPERMPVRLHLSFPVPEREEQTDLERWREREAHRAPWPCPWHDSYGCGTARSGAFLTLTPEQLEAVRFGKLWAEYEPVAEVVPIRGDKPRDAARRRQ